MTTTLAAPPEAPRSSELPSPVPNPLWANVLTMVLILGPIAALAVAVPFLWGAVITWTAVFVALGFYLVTGHGISIGFHRLFTHGSFKASRPLKIVLAVAGSLAVEGSLSGWVAIHRRHHMFSDKEGDPHSPHRYGNGFLAQLHGFYWAHIGWAFAPNDTTAERYAPDMLRDHDLVVVSKLFPLLATVSLTLPFFIGWAITRSVLGGLIVLLWAGLVRMMVLHHVTWSVNSICHMFGKRPNKSTDKSTNFAPLAILSFGESWHNYHHTHPSSARHGAGPHQIDTSAALIRMFEHLGWVTKVRWPVLAPATP